MLWSTELPFVGNPPAKAMDDSYASVEVMSLEPVPSHETVFILVVYLVGPWLIQRRHVIAPATFQWTRTIQLFYKSWKPHFLQDFANGSLLFLLYPRNGISDYGVLHSCCIERHGIVAVQSLLNRKNWSASFHPDCL